MEAYGPGPQTEDKGREVTRGRARRVGMDGGIQVCVKAMAGMWGGRVDESEVGGGSGMESFLGNLFC
jgi:hypothetical protein